MARQVFWAVHNYEVIPCHLIAKKDRDGRGKYAANSKRDKRRFQTAYANPDDAHKIASLYKYIETDLLKDIDKWVEAMADAVGDCSEGIDIV